MKIVIKKDITCWSLSDDVKNHFKNCLKIYFYFYLCVHVWVCAHECGYPQRQKEGFGFLGAGVTGVCEFTNMGVRKQSQFF